MREVGYLWESLEAFHELRAAGLNTKEKKTKNI
jgi:hypothetical protein